MHLYYRFVYAKDRSPAVHGIVQGAHYRVDAVLWNGLRKRPEKMPRKTLCELKDYVAGKAAEGIVNGTYYIKGKAGTAVYNGVYYKNGKPSAGTVGNVKYGTDGKPFTGIEGTGTKAVYYKNGLVFSGVPSLNPSPPASSVPRGPPSAEAPSAAPPAPSPPSGAFSLPPALSPGTPRSARRGPA